MKFEELSKEYQAKVIESFQRTEQEMGFHFLNNELNDKLAEVLKKSEMEVKNLETQYSFSNSQGDGFMFSGDVTWKGRVYMVRHAGYYSHSGCKTLDIDWDDWSREEQKKLVLECKSVQEAMNWLLAEFNIVYVKVCEKLEEYGYECIERALDENTIREDILANDHEFEIKKPGVIYLEHLKPKRY